MKLLAAISTIALMSFSFGANASSKIDTSNIEQTDSLTVCASETNAIQMAKAWDKSWEETDNFIVEHSDDCESVSLRESLPYTIDLATSHDGVVKVTGFSSTSTLWMPIKQAVRDIHAKFGQEYGRGEDYFGLQMYTPMDGLYSSAAKYGQVVALQYVYLLAGKVYSLWYDPRADKVLEMSQLSGSSYNPETYELYLEQPIINKTQKYGRTSEPGRNELTLKDEAVITASFFPSKTLHRQETGLIEMDARPGSRAAIRLIEFTTMVASSVGR